MPEYPDVCAYVAALERRVVNRRLERLAVFGPSVLRTVTPAADGFAGVRVTGVRRIGKKIVLECEHDLYVAMHLMVSGRLHWRDRPPTRPRKSDLAWFVFDGGCLILSEESTRKRAVIHLLRGSDAVDALDAGGIEVMECTLWRSRSRRCWCPSR